MRSAASSATASGCSASPAPARASSSTEFLAEHDLRPQTLTLGSNGAIKEAVRLGLGVSLQSRVAVEQELAAGTLAELRVKGGLPEREWYSLHSATVPPRPAVKLFLEFVNGAGGTPRIRGAGAA